MKRPRGRPRRGGHVGADEVLVVRLTTAERLRLQAQASRAGLSVSDLVRLALERDFCTDVNRERSC